MTWQEELGQLDRKLAAGQISADDYRRQRDRILAAASGGQQAAAPGAPQTPGSGIEQPQPGQNPEARAPFAPPFRWEAVPPNEPTQAVSQGADPNQSAGDAADKTQIVSSDNTADRTQVVPRGAGAGNQGGGPAERTQHIPAIGANQQQPPMQQPNQPTWPPAPGPAPAQDPSNPWGNPDEPLSLWAPGFHQGPEVFETTPNKKSKKTPIIIAVAVVVVLAAAAVLYFTVFKKGNEEAGQNPPPSSGTSAPSTTTEPPQPKAFGPLAIPVGHTGVGKVYTPAQLESTKPLPTPDLVLLKQHGVTRAQSVVGNMDSSTVSLWSFSSKNAKELLSAIVEDQQRFGFEEVPDLKHGTVKVYKSKQKTSTGSTIVAYRAHYVSGNDVIRVEAYDTDDAAAKANFTAALTAQVQHNPPA